MITRLGPVTGLVLATVAGLALALAGPVPPATAAGAAGGPPVVELNPSLAAGDGLPAATRPVLAGLGLDDAVHDVLPAAGAVWVSHGDRLDRFGPDGSGLGGWDLAGAGELGLAAEGDRVFALAADGVQVFDAAGSGPVASWATEPCPRHLASSGGLLLYSYGCPGGPAGVAALDPADGSPRAAALPDPVGSAPVLRSAGSVLVTLEPAAEAGGAVTVRSYQREDDGTLTWLATATAPAIAPADSASAAWTVPDSALSPDGAELLLALADGVQRWETSDLVPTDVTTDQAAAVAYSADGDGFALGLAGSDGDRVQAYDTASGDLVARGAGSDPAAAPVLPGTLRWSADGRLLLALVRPDGGPVSLLTASALPATVSPVSVQLGVPRRFGDQLQVRVAVPDRPATAVRVSVESAEPHAIDGVTDDAGRTAVAADVTSSGRVVVTLPADLTHGASTAVRGFTVPAALDTAMTGFYGSRGAGALRYRSFRSVLGVVSTQPGRAVRVTLVLQEWTGRRWRLSAPPQTVPTDGAGLLGVTMGGGARNVRYRLVALFRGDRRNAAAPQAVSIPWLIG